MINTNTFQCQSEEKTEILANKNRKAYIGLTQAAAIIGIPVHWISTHWEELGLKRYRQPMPGGKVGRNWRYSLEEVNLAAERQQAVNRKAERFAQREAND